MPSARTTNFTVRLDVKVKNDSEKLFQELGLSLSGAFNIFLRQSLRVKGLPFPVCKEVPEAKTLTAMREAMALAADPEAKTYASIAELLQDH